MSVIKKLSRQLLLSEDGSDSLCASNYIALKGLSLLDNNMKKLAITLGKSLFCTIFCLSLCGCFIRPYKFDMYQGNVITPEKVAQITPGMSQEQVRYVLGTPVLNDVFHTQRWDYIYLEKPGFGKEKRRHLAIYFNDGRVDRVSQDPLQDVA